MATSLPTPSYTSPEPIPPMALHETRFPDDISYGSRGGPAYSTNIITMDSGHEVRVARWSQARHSYDASYGIRSLADLNAVLDFFHARQGTAHGFRWKDHMDFSTDASSRGVAAWDDQILGVFGTATDTIQMRKAYTDGGVTTYRNLMKMVSGTVKVGWGGAEKSSGWTVDEDTGIITITDATADAQTIKAGCQFDVPVRFGEELDAGLMLAQDAFDTGSIGSIPIVELKDPTVSPLDYFYGGAKEYTADASHSLADGRVIWSEQASGNITITIPTVTNNMALGGPYFYAIHRGTGGNLLIRDATGNLASLAATEGIMIALTITSGGIRQYTAW